MRRCFAVLAIAVLAAACSDQPTQPTGAKAVRTIRSAQGALPIRFDAGCAVWNSDGSLSDLVGLRGVYTNSANGFFNFQCYGTVLNPEKHVVHFDAAKPPFGLREFLAPRGIDFPNGLVPICDVNFLADPSLSNVICTTNWHNTIAPNGNSMLVVNFDPAHSWSTHRSACDVYPEWYCAE